MGALDGKVAIVTGAGRGIGRGEAVLLAAEGARVVVNDLGTAREGSGADASAAEQVVAEIKGAGGEAVANHDDVASWDGAKALVDQAVDAFGDLHILVNNAGILRDKMSFNTEESDWDAVIRVHLKGHFAPSHHAAVHWRSRAKEGHDTWGRVINTSSEAGLFGNVGQANYSAAKGGIYSLTLSLARELKRFNVTANAIVPRARTRMTEDIFGAAPEGFDELAPENVAPVVGWLASEEAGTVSGQVFFVMGGRVDVLSPFQSVGSVRKDGSWTVDELIKAQEELFAGHPSKPPRFGLA